LNCRFAPACSTDTSRKPPFGPLRAWVGPVFEHAQVHSEVLGALSKALLPDRQALAQWSYVAFDDGSGSSAMALRRSRYATPSGDPTASELIRRSVAIKRRLSAGFARIASMAGTVCRGLERRKDSIAVILFHPALSQPAKCGMSRD